MGDPGEDLRREGMQQLEVKAKDVMNVFLCKENCIRIAEPTLIVCEEVEVAIVEPSEGGWAVKSIACTHQSHGVNPRFKKLQQRMDALVKKSKGSGLTLTTQPCDRCDGSGWVSGDSKEAQMIILTSASMGRFKGIDIGQQVLRSIVDCVTLGDGNSASSNLLFGARPESAPVGRTFDPPEKEAGEEDGEHQDSMQARR